MQDLSYEAWKKHKTPAQTSGGFLRTNGTDELYELWKKDKNAADRMLAETMRNPSASYQQASAFSAMPNLPDFASLDDNIVKLVGDDFKSQWGDKYYYDVLDPEDRQRMTSGMMPKYLAEKYDLSDPVDHYLYENGLPWRDAFSDSYSEQALKLTEQQNKRNGIISGIANDWNTSMQRYADFQSEYFDALNKFKTAKGDVLTDEDYNSVLEGLLTSGRYDDIVTRYTVKPEEDEDTSTIEIYREGLNQPDYSAYDDMLSALQSGGTVSDSFYDTYKESDYKKWLQGKQSFTIDDLKTNYENYVEINDAVTQYQDHVKALRGSDAYKSAKQSGASEEEALKAAEEAPINEYVQTYLQEHQVQQNPIMRVTDPASARSAKEATLGHYNTQMVKPEYTEQDARQSYYRLNYGLTSEEAAAVDAGKADLRALMDAKMQTAEGREQYAMMRAYEASGLGDYYDLDPSDFASAEEYTKAVKEQYGDGRDLEALREAQLWEFDHYGQTYTVSAVDDADTEERILAFKAAYNAYRANAAAYVAANDANYKKIDNATVEQLYAQAVKEYGGAYKNLLNQYVGKEILDGEGNNVGVPKEVKRTIAILVQQGDEENLKRYMESIRTTCDQIKMYERDGKIEKWAGKNFWTKTVATLAGWAAMPIDISINAAVGTVSAAADLFGGSIPMSALANTSDALRQGVAQTIESDGWRTVYNVVPEAAESIGWSVADIASKGATVPAHMAAMAAKGFSSSYKSQVYAGENPTTAFLVGGANALIEAGVEKIGIDNVFSLFDDVAKAATKGAGKAIASSAGRKALYLQLAKQIAVGAAKNAAAEGTEELIGGVLTDIAERAITRDEGEYEKLYAEYKAQNPTATDEEASSYAIGQVIKAAAMDVMLAAVIGGLVGGGTSVYSYSQAKPLYRLETNYEAIKGTPEGDALAKAYAEARMQGEVLTMATAAGLIQDIETMNLPDSVKKAAAEVIDTFVGQPQVWTTKYGMNALNGFVNTVQKHAAKQNTRNAQETARSNRTVARLTEMRNTINQLNQQSRAALDSGDFAAHTQMIQKCNDAMAKYMTAYEQAQADNQAVQAKMQEQNLAAEQEITKVTEAVQALTADEIAFQGRMAREIVDRLVEARPKQPMREQSAMTAMEAAGNKADSDLMARTAVESMTEEERINAFYDILVGNDAAMTNLENPERHKNIQGKAKNGRQTAANNDNMIMEQTLGGVTNESGEQGTSQDSVLRTRVSTDERNGGESNRSGTAEAQRGNPSKYGENRSVERRNRSKQAVKWSAQQDADIRSAVAEYNRINKMNASAQNVREAQNLSENLNNAIAKAKGITGRDSFFFDADGVPFGGFNYSGRQYIKHTGDDVIDIFNLFHEGAHNMPSVVEAIISMLNNGDISKEEYEAYKQLRYKRRAANRGSAATQESERITRSEFTCDMYGCFGAESELEADLWAKYGIENPETAIRIKDAIDDALSASALDEQSEEQIQKRYNRYMSTGEAITVADNPVQFSENDVDVFSEIEYNINEDDAETWKEYVSPSAQKQYSKDPRFKNWAHKDLAFISAASWAGEHIPTDVLMSMPKIQDAEKLINAGATSLGTNPPGTNTLVDEKRKELAQRLLNAEHGSAVFENGKIKKINNVEQFTGEVEQGKHACIVIGRPAGGKSRVFANPLSNKYKARIIDADIVKPWLDGFNDGYGAGYVQEESSYIMERALALAIKRGDNIIIPKIGGSSIVDMANMMKEKGYTVDLYYNEVSEATSIMRAASRFAEEGRYLSLSYLQSIRNKPTETFIEQAESGVFDYAEWRNNDVGFGEEPKLVWRTGEGRLETVLRNTAELGRTSGRDESDAERYRRDTTAVYADILSNDRGSGGRTQKSQRESIEKAPNNGAFSNGDNIRFSDTTEKKSRLNQAWELFETGETPYSYYQKAKADYDPKVANLLRGMLLRNGENVGGALNEDAVTEVLNIFENAKSFRAAELTFSSPVRVFENLTGWKGKTAEERAANIKDGNFLRNTYYEYGNVAAANREVWIAEQMRPVREAIENNGDFGTFESVVAQLLGEKLASEAQARDALTDSKHIIMQVLDGIMIFDRNGKLLYSSDSESNTDYSQMGVKLTKSAREHNTPIYSDLPFKVERNGNSIKVTRANGSVVAEINNGKQPNIRAVKATVDAMRTFYDNTYQQIAKTLVENGYKAPGFIEDYFPHLGQEASGVEAFLQALMDNDLPTAINGMTGIFTPGRPWNANLQERLGSYTEYDAVRGFNRYVKSAADTIHYTPVIQRLRQLEKELRLQGKEALTQEGAVRNSAFVDWLHEYGNEWAKKKSSFDRVVESLAGREAYSAEQMLTGLVSASAVGGSISSAISNVISALTGLAQVNPKNATAETVRTIGQLFQLISKNGQYDGFADKIPFLQRRFADNEDILIRNIDKLRSASNKALYAMFSAVDRFTVESVARAKYAEAKNRGMTEVQAIAAVNDFCIKNFSDRGKGQAARVFGIKWLKPFSQFQMEVLNQMSHFRDMDRAEAETKLFELEKKYGGNVPYEELTKRALSSGSIRKLSKQAMYLLLLSLWGMLTRAIMGRDQTWNPVGMATDTVQGYREEGIKGAAKELWGSASENLPFISIFTEGGRVPILGNVSYVTDVITALLNGEAEDLRVSDFAKAATAFLPGGGQIRKTISGVEALAERGSYSATGKLRYPVTGEDMMRAVLFGSSAVAPKGYDWSDTLSKKESDTYRELTAQGFDSEDLYDMLVNYGGETNSNAEKALTLLEHQGDFTDQQVDIVAAMLGLDYEGSLEDYAKKQTKQYLKAKKKDLKDGEITEEEYEETENIFDEYFRLLGIN